jgi:hypothetical protein
MAEAFVKPEDLADLVGCDAAVTSLYFLAGVAGCSGWSCGRVGSSRSGSQSRDIKSVWVLKGDGEIEKISDVHVEHISMRIYCSLVE